MMSLEPMAGMLPPPLHPAYRSYQSHQRKRRNAGIETSEHSIIVESVVVPSVHSLLTYDAPHAHLLLLTGAFQSAFQQDQDSLCISGDLCHYGP